MHPIISIITVCYNAQDTIKKTIESVLNQTYASIEHIIIDGGSSDKTIEIVSKYKDQLATFISEPDNGIYHAMNKGIEQSRGEYVLFLNADDYLFSENSIEIAISNISETNATSDIYYGDLLSFDKKFGKASIWIPKKATTSFLFKGSLPHPSTIYKRSLFEDLGTYDEQLMIAADYEFYIRAHLANKQIQHINCLISVFSVDGVSNQPEHKATIAIEKQAIHDKHFSKREQFRLKLTIKLKKLLGL